MQLQAVRVWTFSGLWIGNGRRLTASKSPSMARGAKEDPKSYETIDLEYKLEGKGLRKDAVERAIRLSQEKYCSVRAMIKPSVKLNITYTIANGTDPVQNYTYSPQKSDE